MGKGRQRRRQAARTVSEFRRHRRSVGIRFAGLRLYVLWPDHDIQHRQYLGHGRCKRRRYHSDYAGRYRRCYCGHPCPHHRHFRAHDLNRRHSRANLHRHGGKACLSLHSGGGYGVYVDIRRQKPARHKAGQIHGYHHIEHSKPNRQQGEVRDRWCRGRNARVAQSIFCKRGSNADCKRPDMLGVRLRGRRYGITKRIYKA